MLSRGTQIDQYVLEELLGSGGMGEVYVALDTRLQRKVALKLLPRATAGDDDARMRMVREARAASALKHPGIVTVYGVGEDSARSYIAMELIEGETFAAMLARRGRLPAAEAVDLIARVGEALSTAHQAGILHRDIKSANLMVDARGAVKVLDFGLSKRVSGDVEATLSARPLPPSASPVVPAPPDPDSTTLAAPLSGSGSTETQAGQRMGTPAYAAPELWSGAPVDLRCDVFSLGVVLYELLVGRRPFEPGGPVDLRLRMTQESYPPPSAAGVDARFDAVIARALRADPGARYRSVDELVAAARAVTQARPKHPMRWLAAGVVAAGLATAGAFAIPRQEPCRAGADELAGVWDAEVKARLGKKLTALAPSYAASTWREVERLVDGHAARWARAHDAGCAGDDPLRDRRNACLGERRQALALVVAALERTDAATLTQATQIARALPRVEDCADRGYLAGIRRDAAGARINEDLVAAQMHYVAGRDAAGREPAQRARDAARAAGDRLREAEALVLLGRLQHEEDPSAAMASLTEAATLAGETGASGVRIDAWNHLAHAYMRVGRMDEARKILDLAFALIADAPDRWREADLHFTRGVWAGRSGKFEDARRDLERGLAIYIELVGPDSQFLNAAHGNLAIVYRRLGRIDQAAHHARRSLALARLLGDEHPATAAAHGDVGLVLSEMGALADALAELERSEAILIELHGQRHEQVALAQANVGEVLARMGRWGDARARFDAALITQQAVAGDPRFIAAARASLGASLVMTGDAVAGERVLREALAEERKLVGADHVDVGVGHRLLGEALLAQGRAREALAELEQASTLVEKAAGAEHPELARVRSAQAAVRRHERKFAAALALDEQAAALFAKALPADHPDVVGTRLALAGDHLGLGARDKAISLAEEALAYYEARKNPAQSGAARWLLARARNDRELAKRAREDLVRAGTPQDLAAIDRFVAP